MKTRYKFAFSVSLISFTLLTLFVLYFTFMQANIQNKRLEEKMGQTMKLTSSIISFQLWNFDFFSIQTSIEGIVKDSEISEIFVYDLQGKIISKSLEKSIHEKAFKISKIETLFNDNTPIGRIEVVFSKQQINKNFKIFLIQIITTLSIIQVIISMLVFVLSKNIEEKDTVLNTNKKLLLSEENLRTTLNSIGDAVIAVDLNGSITHINPIACKLTASNAKSSIGRPLNEIFNIFNVKTEKKQINPVEKAIQTGEIVGLTNHTILISLDENKYQISYSASPIRDDSQNITGVVLAFRDITKEYQAQKNIEETNAVLKSIVELSPIPMILVSTENYIMRLINKAAIDYLGIENNNLAGKKISEIEWVWEEKTMDNDLIDKKDSPILCALQGKVTKHRELKLIDKNGSIRYHITDAFPIFNSQGDIIAGFVIFPDITDLRVGEQKRHALESQLIQSQKLEAIGRLAGGIAHDYNNMLSVILSHTEMALKKTDPNDNNYRKFEQIRKAAIRSADLTKQILSFARKQSINSQIINVQKKIIELNDFLSSIIGENKKLNISLHETDAFIKIDQTQFDQLISNLIINARDAIEENGIITLKLSFILGEEISKQYNVNAKSSNYIELSIEDNGHGMDNDTLQNAFEPFFTTKTSGKGTGLGLATVYGIVSQNNGFIHIDSKINYGTKITIHFPAEKDSIEATVTNEHNLENLNFNGSILLVEDEEMVLEVTKSILIDLGYKVYSAQTAKDALKIALDPKISIDLLISDVIMPGMNGKELSNRISEILPDIKILFISGYTAGEIIDNDISQNIINLIKKPFTLEEIKNKINSIFNH